MFTNIRRFWRFLYQKLKRGWDDSETWSLDYSLAKLIHPRLKRFKELNNGYPVQVGSGQKWDEIIDKMIYSFEFYASERKYDKIEPEEWDKVCEGMKLFAEYYPDLWW